MFYDTLLQLAHDQEGFNHLVPALKAAQRYRFTAPAHDYFLKHDLPENKWEAGFLTFVLPNQVIWVEDPASGFLIADTEEGAVGCNTPRDYLEIIDISQGTEFVDPRITERSKDPLEKLKNHYLIVTGTIESIDPDPGTGCHAGRVNCTSAIVWNTDHPDGASPHLTGDRLQEISGLIADKSSRNAVCAIRQMIWLTQSDVTVETSGTERVVPLA